MTSPSRQASFVPQSRHRINLGCAARGNITSGQGNQREKKSHAHKRCRIGRANTVEQALKVARQSKRSRQACDGADKGESNALPHNQAEDIALLSSHGRANADFTGAASHFVGKQAIEAKAGKRQSEQGEKAREVGDQALAEEGAINLFGLRRENGRRKMSVQLLDNAPSDRDQRLGCCPGAKLEDDSPLFKGKVFGGFDRLFQIVISCIASHADNFRARIVLRRTQMEANGTAAFQIFLDKSPVDNRHFVLGTEIGWSESAARQQVDAPGSKEARSDREQIPFNEFLLSLKGDVAAPQAATEKRL